MEEDSVLTELSTQVHVEWKIKKFIELPQEDSYFRRSPNFSLSNEKWKILIYPNGDSSVESRGWICLSLKKEEVTTDFRVAFILGIKRSDGSELKSFHRQETFREFRTYGYYKLCKRSEVLNSENILTDDGTLTVFCTARIVNNKSTGCGTSSAYGIPTLTENLKELFLNKDHADITIKVKNREFSAHKCMIAARSEVFALMFKHDMVEKSSGAVEIADCDPDSFEDFLQFLYTASMDVVSPTNAVSLYKTAHKYKLEDLKEECVRCMNRNFSINSICDVIHLAHIYEESDLLESSTRFFVRNALSIHKTTQWRTFMDENGDLANELCIKTLENMYLDSDLDSDDDSDDD